VTQKRRKNDARFRKNPKARESLGKGFSVVEEEKKGKKPRKPSKEKPRKVKKPKKAKAVTDGAKAGKKSKKKFLLLIPVALLAAALAVIFVVRPFDKDEEETPEEGTVAQNWIPSYIFNSDAAPAFDSLLNQHTGGVRAAVLRGSTPVDANGEPISVMDLTLETEPEVAEGAKGDKGATASTTAATDATAAAAAPEDETGGNGELPEPVSYDYLQLRAANVIVEKYVETLMNADPPFSLAEDEEEPDFRAQHGSVSLIRDARELSEKDLDAVRDPAKKKELDKKKAKEAKKEAKKASKKKDAEAETAEEEPAEGETKERIVSEDGVVRRLCMDIDWGKDNCLVTLSMIDVDPFSKSISDPPLSYTMVKDMMRTLHPSEIGLTGESMDDYLMIPGPGVVSIDNKACVKLTVYDVNEYGSNQLAGTYFISQMGHELYRQVGNTFEVEKIELQTDVPLDYEDLMAQPLEGEEDTEGAEGSDTEGNAEGEGEEGADAESEEQPGGVRGVFRKVTGFFGGIKDFFTGIPGKVKGLFGGGEDESTTPEELEPSEDVGAAYIAARIFHSF